MGRGRPTAVAAPGLAMLVLFAMLADGALAAGPHQASPQENVPPHIDATAAITTSDLLPADPASWPTSATLDASRSSEARIVLRMDGRGRSLWQSRPEQTVIVYSNSASMAWNDPTNLRCEGMKRNLAGARAPEEIGLAEFETTSRLAVPLTTQYQNVANWIDCYSTGGSDIAAGLNDALDHLVPARKPGYVWLLLLLSDGCWTGEDPSVAVGRAVNESVRIFTFGMYSDNSSQEKTRCEKDLISWAQRTGGKYHLPRSPSDFDRQPDIPCCLKNDVAGKPPRSGAPMVRAKMMPSMEVLPGSFRCLSEKCAGAAPTSPPLIETGNRGLDLQWVAPVKELRAKEVWMLEFWVRATKVERVDVLEQGKSSVEYDRFDGSPGGSDRFPRLTLDVNRPPGAGCAVAPPGPIEHVPVKESAAGAGFMVAARLPRGESASVALVRLVSAWGESRLLPMTISADQVQVGVPGELVRPPFVRYRIEVSFTSQWVGSDPPGPNATHEVAVWGWAGNDVQEEPPVLPFALVSLMTIAGVAIAAMLARTREEESDRVPGHASISRPPGPGTGASPRVRDAARRAAAQRRRTGGDHHASRSSSLRASASTVSQVRVVASTPSSLSKNTVTSTGSPYTTR